MSFLGTGFGASGSYSITNSARFNGTSDYLSRTPGVAGNRKTWTLSFWVKRAALGTNQYILDAAASLGNSADLYFDVNDRLQFNDSLAGGFINFAPQFRDPSAWQHFLLVFDDTQATNTNRVKLYQNGTQLSTTGSPTWPTQNADGYVNGTYAHQIGRYGPNNNGYASLYLSDVYLIDGQALTPTSFGKTDSNGVWVPIKYAGTYGTNGFKLAFGSSGALGTDTSGNGNTWTVSGSPVQTTDTPTNNYCTINPLRRSEGTTTALTEGNLRITAVSTADDVHGVTLLPDAKHYFEFSTPVVGTYGFGIGVGSASNSVTTDATYSTYRVMRPVNGTLYTSTGGTGWSSGSSGTAYGSGLNTTDVGMCCIDKAANKIWFGKNGTWFNSGDPVTGANSAFSDLNLLANLEIIIQSPSPSGAPSAVFNFGQKTFAYTPPTGFKALCTANLTSTAVTTGGTFTGNANADGPFIWTNGNPATLTINGNAVTFGTHADKTAGGFKLRSSSASYNTSGSNTWTATAGKRFVYSATSINTAQGNP